MRLARWLGVAVGGLGLASLCAAQDTLELRDGRLLRGLFLGGTANSVRFEDQNGAMQVFSRDELVAVTFGSFGGGAGTTPTQVGSGPTPVITPAPEERPANLKVSAGTILLVRLEQTLATNRNREGERFQATLEHDVLSDGRVAVRRGTRVFGTISGISGAGRVAGRPEIRLQLREIDMDGRLVPVQTSSFAESGASSFAGTARNAGLGAGVGAAFNGGRGAARGAAIGGATSVLSQGDVITVPAGTTLEFRLTQSLLVP